MKTKFMSQKEPTSQSPVDIADTIEFLLDNPPLKKNRIAYKEWIKEVNTLMTGYNDTYGKTYTLRK